MCALFSYNIYLLMSIPKKNTGSREFWLKAKFVTFRIIYYTAAKNVRILL